MRTQAVTFHRSVPEETGRTPRRRCRPRQVQVPRAGCNSCSTTLIRAIRTARIYDLIEQHIDMLMNYLLNRATIEDTTTNTVRKYVFYT